MSNPTLTIPQRLEAAGVQYPLGWNEMGSSEKDMWEDRRLRAIDRLSRHTK